MREKMRERMREKHLRERVPVRGRPYERERRRDSPRVRGRGTELSNDYGRVCSHGREGGGTAMHIPHVVGAKSVTGAMEVCTARVAVNL